MSDATALPPGPDPAEPQFRITADELRLLQQHRATAAARQPQAGIQHKLVDPVFLLRDLRSEIEAEIEPTSTDSKWAIVRIIDRRLVALGHDPTQ